MKQNRCAVIPLEALAKFSPTEISHASKPRKGDQFSSQATEAPRVVPKGLDQGPKKVPTFSKRFSYLGNVSFGVSVCVIQFSMGFEGSSFCSWGLVTSMGKSTSLSEN